MLLHKSGSLPDKDLYNKLLSSYEILSVKIFRFIRAVEGSHESPHYLKNGPVASEDLNRPEFESDKPEGEGL